MRVAVAGVTHRGVARDHNEDCIALGPLVSSAQDGVPVRFELDTALPVLLAVADGLGGHAAGERASRTALTLLASSAGALRGAAEVVEAVGRADRAVHEEMGLDRAFSGMATTLAALVLHGSQAWCANVGDSRCYAAQGDALVQLSVDDSLAPLPGQGRVVSSVVTSTLGGGPGAPVPGVHLHAFPVLPGDRYLVCSDGLSGVVPLGEVEAAVCSDRPLEVVVAELLRAALAAGGPDNVSVVLAEVLGDGDEAEEAEA